MKEMLTLIMITMIIETKETYKRHITLMLLLIAITEVKPTLFYLRLRSQTFIETFFPTPSLFLTLLTKTRASQMSMDFLSRLTLVLQTSVYSSSSNNRVIIIEMAQILNRKLQKGQ